MSAANITSVVLSNASVNSNKNKELAVKIQINDLGLSSQLKTVSLIVNNVDAGAMSKIAVPLVNNNMEIDPATWSQGVYQNITGLTNGSKYQIVCSVVYTNDADILSVISSNSVADTPITVPSQPKFTARSDDRKIILTPGAFENGSSDITDFIVYISKLSKNGQATGMYSHTFTKADVDANGMVFTHIVQGSSTDSEKLVNGEQYEVSMAAVNAAGVSELSETKTISPNNYPDQVTNLLATGSDSKLTINWTPNADWNDAVSTRNTGATVAYRVDPTISVDQLRQVYSLPTTNTDAEVRAYAADNDRWNSISINTPITEATNTVSASILSTYQLSGLMNGILYEVKVSAKNVFGSGPFSDSVYRIPRKPSSAVTDLLLNPLDSSVEISFKRPSNFGGLTEAGYWIYMKLSSDDDSQYQGQTIIYADDSLETYNYTTNNLDNGTKYTFKVVPFTNGDDTDEDGLEGISASAEVIPFADPVAPTAAASNSVVVGNGYYTLNWVAPANNTGLELYYNIIDAGVEIGSQTGTTVTVNNLLNGVDHNIDVYSYVVSPVDGSRRHSHDSLTFRNVRPVDKPGLVQNFVTVPGDQQVTMYWSAPASTGGQTLAGYEVTYEASYPQFWSTILPDNLTVVLDDENITEEDKPYIGKYKHIYTNLTNGRDYSFAVRFIGNVSTGNYISVRDTPVGAPSAPDANSLKIFPGDASVRVSFIPPTNTGGVHVSSLNYEVSLNDVVNMTTSSTDFVVNGLTNGVSYILSIKSKATSGTSLPVRTPVFIPNSAPSAVQDLTAVPGNETVTLNWKKPVSLGAGYANSLQHTYVKAYIILNELEEEIGVVNQATTNSDASRSIIISNNTANSKNEIKAQLQNGTATTYQVIPVITNLLTQTDVYGTPASVTFTPFTRPDAPTDLVTTLGDGRISLSWTAGNNGGYAQLFEVAYKLHNALNSTYVIDNTVSGTTYTIENLTNNTAYDIRIRAKTIPPSGTPLFSADSVTTNIVPNPQPGDINYTVTPGDSSFKIRFADNLKTSYTLQDYAIDVYRVIDNTHILNASTSLNYFDVTNLDNGYEYKVNIYANYIGVNRPDASSNTKTLRVTPFGAPVINAITRTGKSFSINLKNNGSAITGAYFIGVPDKISPSDKVLYQATAAEFAQLPLNGGKTFADSSSTLTFSNKFTFTDTSAVLSKVSVFISNAAGITYSVNP